MHDALASGAAVALFPEGISHSEPSLAPLKTGAARIALGAAPRAGGAFPIVPIGLVFRAKEIFRSEAHASVGADFGKPEVTTGAERAGQQPGGDCTTQSPAPGGRLSSRASAQPVRARGHGHRHPLL